MNVMNEHEAAKAKAAATYNTAADYFDHPVSSFWHCFGRLTIEGMALRPGEFVLDVCSGSGDSALPAAEQVGPQGKVIAADLAERLIALAKAKAEVKKLDNIEFRACLTWGIQMAVSMQWFACSVSSSCRI